MAVTNPWKIDPARSKIAFKVGYMQLGVITGEFGVFDGFVECDDDFEDMKARVTVDSRSVTTFHALRDQGIRSPDVFDAAHYPLVHFTSAAFRRVSTGGLFELSALLTIRGLTVPIRAMVSLTSLTAAEAIFKFSGNLSRGAFGLGGPGTIDQENVDDTVEFFGEMGIRRDGDFGTLIE